MSLHQLSLTTALSLSLSLALSLTFSTVAHAEANAILTSLAPAFDHVASEIKAAKAAEKDTPDIASARYQGAAQYVDAVLMQIAPLEKAGGLKKDGTVQTQSAGTLSAKDFLTKLKAMQKEASAAVKRLQPKVDAVNKKNADTQQKAFLERKAAADAAAKAPPPPNAASVALTNLLGETICEVNTISQARNHARIEHLKGKAPLGAKKSIAFSLAPGKYNIFIAACGKTNDRRAGAITVKLDAKDTLTVSVAPKLKQHLDWKLLRTRAAPPANAAASRATSARASPAPSYGAAYSEPAPTSGDVAGGYEYEAPVAVSGDMGGDDVAAAPPPDEPAPEPEPAAPPPCKPAGTPCSSYSECCGHSPSCRMQSFVDEMSGGNYQTGPEVCIE
jgi:hypothetical protein